MTQTDLLYRAFGAAEKSLSGDRQTAAFMNAFANAKEPDTVVVTHNVCHVDEDWVAAIERGLYFIGKAIEEDRQFIRSNGEVKPIEKVRHISKESVEHLSKHSDLITREPKEEIIPDKLYTVERLNDYTVYENRFLYLLLTKIRDFVSVRYDAIMRAYKTYRGEYASTKKVVMGARRVTFECKLVDEQDDVLSAAADKECASYLERMDKIRQSVAFYLKTPLMVEVARADKIKTKIQKTNVLRMDKNFKEAVTLYEFLLSYDRDGYAIEQQVDKLSHIEEAIAREFTVPAVFLSFLVYEHGLGIEDFLREEYEKEEARRKEAEQAALVEELKALKKRIEESGEGAEGYMLLLEARNAELENDRKRLVEAQEKIEELGAEIESLRQEAAVLRQEIEQLTEANQKLVDEMKRMEEEHARKIEEMQREFEEEREKLKAAHAEELDRLNEEHAGEIRRLRQQQTEAIDRLNEAHAEEIGRLKAAQAEQVERLETQRREEVLRIRRECDAKLHDGNVKIAEKEKERVRVKQQLESTQRELSLVGRECDVVKARLTALRREYGLLTEADDFTTEEGFNGLEHEFEVLGKLVREKWTDVRKILRKEFYGAIRQTIRGKKRGQKSEEYRELCEELGARGAKSEEKEEKQEPQPAPAAPAESTPEAEEAPAPLPPEAPEESAPPAEADSEGKEAEAPEVPAAEEGSPTKSGESGEVQKPRKRRTKAAPAESGGAQADGPEAVPAETGVKKTGAKRASAKKTGAQKAKNETADAGKAEGIEAEAQEGRPAEEKEHNGRDGEEGRADCGSEESSAG